MSIRVVQLSAEIMHQLQAYTKEVVQGMDEVGESTSKAGAKSLKETSPKRKGRYAKGWAVNREVRFGKPTRFTIYNKNKPQLAHLLEHGHANKNGTRTPGRPHIAPVEQEVVNEYLKGVEAVIKSG